VDGCHAFLVVPNLSIFLDHSKEIRPLFLVSLKCLNVLPYIVSRTFLLDIHRRLHNY